MKPASSICVGLALLLASGCTEPSEEGGDPNSGETSASGDGDGDPATASGDGDGDPSGDGDGDTSGDGDGDSTSGDGDGDEAACPPGLLDELTLEQSYESPDYGWAKVERWSSSNPGFEQEQFLPEPRSEQMAQRLEFFDFDPTPHSSKFLLYYAPGWEAAIESGRTPVLLAHGANDNADRAWSDPGESGDFGCGQAECPNTGLMQALAEAGYPVFALNMAHSQGDNFYWSEQIHSAINIIREQACVDQVDLIGWSKGAFSSRMYTSSVTQPWSTPYAGDVRKQILIGGPNLGFDYLFRYGTAHNLGVWPPNGSIHAPLPHDTQVIGLQTIDYAEYAVYETSAGDFFRGQRQMVAMWIDEYPLTMFAENGFGPYAVADSLSTYWGEGDYLGLLARGRGIEFTINQGSLVEEIVEAGTDPGVETFLLCSEIVSMDAYIPGIPNEIAGPSDGVVFVESCAAPDGIGQLGQIAILEDVNHLELGWHPMSVAQITEWLGE